MPDKGAYFITVAISHHLPQLIHFLAGVPWDWSRRLTSVTTASFPCNSVSMSYRGHDLWRGLALLPMFDASLAKRVEPEPLSRTSNHYVFSTPAARCMTDVGQLRNYSLPNRCKPSIMIETSIDMSTYSVSQPAESLTLEHLRTRLINLAPTLEKMATNLPRWNADYEDVTSTPLKLIGFLCKDSPEDVDKACRGYISFCQTFDDKQREFVSKERYAETDFGSVNEQVYQNLEYMSGIYYPALLFSYLFSSNYFAIYRAFRNSFIPLCQSLSGATLEVGIGHGLLSASLLSVNPRLTGYGLDISPAAPEISSRVSSFFRLAHPITTTVGDAVANIPLQSETPYRVMVCAEVLEHLSDPARLLRNMHSKLEDGGILFLTASINMESVDHLYLFHSDQEVVQMVQECGFRLLRCELAFLTVQPYRDNPKIIERLRKMANPATVILIAAKN
jgi:2-polyprenyl-3-methyl-5-hydroxy-6-metoxy-1,4-benzoquinol methylase